VWPATIGSEAARSLAQKGHDLGDERPISRLNKVKGALQTHVVSELADVGVAGAIAGDDCGVLRVVRISATVPVFRAPLECTR
jgi:hypothetical protein